MLDQGAKKGRSPNENEWLRRIARVAIGCSRALAVSAAMFALVSSFASPARASDAAEASKIFNQRCTACHTYGKGVKVGPDLKGVTERRTRPWLLKFIRSSQTVIESGDPTAKQLFQDFKSQRMPDWSDLSEEQVTSVLDWFAKAGPDEKPIDARNAETATASEIERGRSLFYGGAPLTSGGLACVSCHGVHEGGGDPDELKGGTLGPNLTTAYTRYQDRALTLFFKHPCFRRQPDSTAAAYLTPKESFALKAYLREIAMAQLPSTPSAKRNEP